MNIDKHQWNDLVGGVRAASLVALLTAGAIAGMAMSAQAAPDKPAAEQCRKPRQTAGDLELVAEYAEDIFYLARINAWHRIDKKARLFKLQPAAASSPKDASTPDMAKTIADLEQSISARDRYKTMHDANKLLLMAASLVEPYLSVIPRNVLLLGYCGRRLEILSESGQTAKMPDIIAKMHLIWQNLIIQLVERGATKDVKRFAEILKQLDQAKSPEEIRKLAKSVQDEVDNLEKLFLK
ncbi:hypothetical protein [Geobacter sp. SVR]|uniref:hypothetical protein n=1 Tax=Geobacter sp. SVR TaxID=2495594 RepID=UPI00143F02B2|nr:hypothetical protein [Geobacter sp. SVR]BCS54863.1 hypothetical protein GSVR_31710 [Geobacter sp. SVR]GCF87381.1 hypothetical protein GSbR_39810 [Geobacter sp. SVR]